MTMPEGTAAFRLLGKKGETGHDGVSVVAEYLDSGVIDVRVHGVRASEVKFFKPSPPLPVHVVVTWTPKEVTLYLNGQSVEAKEK